jgi:hypothetical protein
MRTLVPSLLAFSFLVSGPTPATAAGGRTTPAVAKPPKITRRAKPVAMQLESIALPVNPSDQPAFNPIPLTAEQVAVDTITLDGATLGTPQLGMNVTRGIVRGIPTPGLRNVLLEASGYLEIFVQVAWVGTHPLQVDCKGLVDQPMRVRYGRWGGQAGQDLGSMNINPTGDGSLSFAIAGENHGASEYLIIYVRDADSSTKGTTFHQCTFERL